MPSEKTSKKEQKFGNTCQTESHSLCIELQLITIQHRKLLRTLPYIMIILIVTMHVHNT